MPNLIHTIVTLGSSFFSSAPPKGAYERFIHAVELLSSPDPDTRMLGIKQLGQSGEMAAIDATINVFQAYPTGKENLAAQEALVSLCHTHPCQSLAVSARMVRLLTASALRGEVSPQSEEFVRACDTFSQLVSSSKSGERDMQDVHEALSAWYRGAKPGFQLAPAELTLADPMRQGADFRLYEKTTAALQRPVQAMAMLMQLMTGINTQTTEQIRIDLLSHIRPDGFGKMVLGRLGSLQGRTALKSALVELKERWEKFASGRMVGLLPAQQALNDMLDGQSAAEDR